MKAGTIALVLACAAFGNGAFAQTVRVEGSSAGEPIARAAAEAFRRAVNSKVDIRIGVSGSSGGIERLCRDQADIAILARRLEPKEAELCTGTAAPGVEPAIAQDAMTVVVNIANSFVQAITLEQLRAIWEASAQGRLIRWRQVHPDWPDAPLKLYGPDPQFGDSASFNSSVLGTAAPARRDYTASAEDAVLAQGMARDANALGYLPLAYYEKNRARLRSVPVVTGATAVAPTARNVELGLYGALSRSLIVYVNARSLARAEVAAFAEYLIANGATFARSAGYAALPEADYGSGLSALRAAGSAQ